jgi:hypothetical protein
MVTIALFSTDIRLLVLTASSHRSLCLQLVDITARRKSVHGWQFGSIESKVNRGQGHLQETRKGIPSSMVIALEMVTCQKTLVPCAK